MNRQWASTYSCDKCGRKNLPTRQCSQCRVVVRCDKCNGYGRITKPRPV